MAELEIGEGEKLKGRPEYPCTCVPDWIQGEPCDGCKRNEMAKSEAITATGALIWNPNADPVFGDSKMVRIVDINGDVYEGQLGAPTVKEDLAEGVTAMDYPITNVRKVHNAT